MAAGERDGAKQLPQVERLSAETWVPAPCTPGGQALRPAGALAPYPPGKQQSCLTEGSHTPASPSPEAISAHVIVHL